VRPRAARDPGAAGVIVDSGPSVLDRTAYPEGDGPDSLPIFKSAARRLAAAGTELLVIACNTAKALLADVVQSVSAWSIGLAKPHGRRPAPRCSPSILATTGTLATDLDQDANGAPDLKVIVLDAVHPTKLMRIIYGP
jgi:aspartate/glutamate racemase